LDIIDLDMPSGGVIKISSSCNLFAFSSKTDPQRAEGIGDTPEGSSSVSIRELWPDIDKLDEISRRGASAGNAPRGMLREEKSLPLVKKTDEHASRRSKRALLDHAPRPPRTLPRCHRGNSVKNKATRILSAAPGAISPRMRRSFVDRQYSPSTSMDLSEWEIILEELIHMGYIIKKEPDSDGNE
jgi:hypothetical protein